MIYLSDGGKDLCITASTLPCILFRVLLQSVLPVGAAVILLMHLQRLLMADFNGSQEQKQPPDPILGYCFLSELLVLVLNPNFPELQIILHLIMSPLAYPTVEIKPEIPLTVDPLSPLDLRTDLRMLGPGSDPGMWERQLQQELLLIQKQQQIQKQLLISEFQKQHEKLTRQHQAQLQEHLKVSAALPSTQQTPQHSGTRLTVCSDKHYTAEQLKGPV